MNPLDMILERLIKGSESDLIWPALGVWAAVSLTPPVFNMLSSVRFKRPHLERTRLALEIAKLRYEIEMIKSTREFLPAQVEEIESLVGTQVALPAPVAKSRSYSSRFWWCLAGSFSFYGLVALVFAFDSVQDFGGTGERIGFGFFLALLVVVTSGWRPPFRGARVGWVHSLRMAFSPRSLRR
jgi:hypothetical protein